MKTRTLPELYEIYPITKQTIREVYEMVNNLSLTEAILIVSMKYHENPVHLARQYKAITEHDSKQL